MNRNVSVLFHPQRRRREDKPDGAQMRHRAMTYRLADALLLAGVRLLAGAVLPCLTIVAATPATALNTKSMRSDATPSTGESPTAAPLRRLAESAGLLRGGRLDGARVTIFKQPHRLVVSAHGIPVKTYRIELGRDPDLPKERLGDGRTPEGEYYICERRQATRYHRGLLLSYPNEIDAARGFAYGLISLQEAAAIRRAIAARTCPPQNTALGGMILIHGQHPKETAYWEEVRRGSAPIIPAGLEAGDRDPAAHMDRTDWTLGCIGLPNQDIRELYDLLPPGTPVTIRDNE